MLSGTTRIEIEVSKQLLKKQAEFKQERKGNYVTRALAVSAYPLLFIAVIASVILLCEIYIRRSFESIDKDISNFNPNSEGLENYLFLMSYLPFFKLLDTDEIRTYLNQTINISSLPLGNETLMDSNGTYSQEQFLKLVNTAKIVFPHLKDFCTQHFCSANIWISLTLVALLITAAIKKIDPINNFSNFYTTKGFLNKYYPDCLTDYELEYSSLALDTENIDLNKPMTFQNLYYRIAPSLRTRIEQDLNSEKIDKIKKSALISSRPENLARIQQIPSDIKNIILGEAFGKDNAKQILNHFNNKNVASSNSVLPQGTLPVSVVSISSLGR